ncbi:MAG: hypothetical protein GY844_05620 [Bradyrhizobium sp.]|nr:hypothetical protein [Bradyrhizobium sp.]
MKPKLLFFAVVCGASIATGEVANSMSCEVHVKNRPTLDVKVLSLFLGKDNPAEIEEMIAWLDRYCPENPAENVTSAIRKFVREKRSRQ